MMPHGWALQTQQQNFRTQCAWSSTPHRQQLIPMQPAWVRLYLHIHTHEERERQQSNGFSRSSLHLFIFILPVTAEQQKGFPGCHKPRNILMKNKCIYRETSKQPKTSQSNVPGLGMSAFVSSPLHCLQAAERQKYFKQRHSGDAQLCIDWITSLAILQTHFSVEGPIQVDTRNLAFNRKPKYK